MSNTFIDALCQTKNLSNSNFIRVSTNIININPVPIYIKPEIDNLSLINDEFNIISLGMNKEFLYIDKNQDPNKTVGIFMSQNAYVPYNNILNSKNIYIDEIKSKILEGINELLITIYNLEGEYKYEILNSWIQKYKDGNFLSPHNHISNRDNITGKKSTIFSIAYYIDDGDPDLKQTYSGCISFINNNELIHIRPKTGTLLIWKNDLIHLVNPFYSKSSKERFLLSANIRVEF